VTSRTRRRSPAAIGLVLALPVLALTGPGSARAADDAAAATAPAAPAAPAEGAAQAVAAVEDLHAALLGVMQEADALGFEGRRERIEPVLRRHYDFAFMAEKSVGRGWNELEAAQRQQLVDAFARLAIATYAARFDGFSGESFETLGTQPATHGTLLVRTRLVRPKDEPVQLDYRLREVDDAWRIIDVFLNGTVSELALRRAEYSAVLRRDGFDELMSALETKIAAQARGGSAEPKS